MKIKIAIIFFLGIICYTNCNSQQKEPISKPAKDSIYTYREPSMDGTGKFYFGREISQVMGADGSGWLERSERNKEENTNLAIDKINLAANHIVADIGAGTGYYSFKLSRKVPKGKVFAVEIQDKLINILRDKKSQLKDSVVEIIKGSNLSSNLPDNSIDLAIMVDVYHELEYPHEMLQAIKKSLKANGKLLLIEYRAEDPAVQIKPLHKTSVAQLTKELSANGFSVSFNGDFLPIQHFLMFKKK